MNLLFLFACFIQSQDPVFKYTITGTDEEKTVGVTADEFDLATSPAKAITADIQARTAKVPH